jgi:hypothetical protein
MSNNASIPFLHWAVMEDQHLSAEAMQQELGAMWGVPRKFMKFIAICSL